MEYFVKIYCSKSDIKELEKLSDDKVGFTLIKSTANDVTATATLLMDRIDYLFNIGKIIGIRESTKAIKKW